MPPILRTEKLSKSFLLAGQPRLILDGLSFEMDSEAFVSVVGSSGCGKSTWLELLAGITHPDSGEIYYRGEKITGKTGLLGYMPQDDLLFPWLSVVENVLLPVRVRDSDIKTAREKVHKLLPVFGLEEHAAHLPYQLSGGLRQRAAFLRTVMTDTQLLLLDEPFASLDAITRLQLQNWLKDITTELKLSIIFVTHDIDEALNLSDEIQVMRGKPGRFAGAFKLGERGKLNEPERAALKRQILELVADGMTAGETL